jgi:hypothetical protein
MRPAASVVKTDNEMIMALKVRITVKIARQEVEDIIRKDWILDSAVTHHFCMDKSQFETLYSAESEEIEIANGEIVWSAGLEP